MSHEIAPNLFNLTYLAFLVPSLRYCHSRGKHARQDPQHWAHGRPGVPSAGRLRPQWRQHAAFLQHRRHASVLQQHSGPQGQRPGPEDAHLHQKLVGPFPRIPRHQPDPTADLEPEPPAEHAALHPCVRAAGQAPAGHRRGSAGELQGRRAVWLCGRALPHGQEKPTLDGRVLPCRLRPGSGAPGKDGATNGELRQAGGSTDANGREGELLSCAGGLVVHDGREVKEWARKPQKPQ